MTTENTRKKILIVDDTPANIQLLGSILQDKYVVSFAESGKEALARLEKTDFDLILLDIMMPEMDGFEVCKRVRSNPKTKKIPIIFLSAKTDRESVMEGLELGGQDYIAKPYDARELIKRVETQLRIREQEKLIEESQKKDKSEKLDTRTINNLEFSNRKMFYEKLMFLTIYENIKQRFRMIKDRELFLQNDPTIALAQMEKIFLVTKNYLVNNKEVLAKNIPEATKEIFSAFSKAELQKDIVLIREVLKHHSTISNGLFFIKEYFSMLKDHVTHTDMDPTNLSEEIEMAIEEIVPILPATIDISITISPIEEKTTIDRNHLFLALAHNLLLSADSIISSSEEGKIMVKAYLHGGVVFIEITDTGKGLDAESRKSIIRAFDEQALDTGIEAMGLATIKQILVNNYQGALVIEQEGEGTKTTIQIPMENIKEK
ncbi:response regulator [Spirochaetia bacterium 38H-sp]|uniref:Response regulator n=1 Tax=Rarispira pelagica TaxID=3141764 RepID=A0ABU9UDL3_9SPIR